VERREVEITADGRRLQATLTLPEDPAALVIFAHGSGSSRHSPRVTGQFDVMLHFGTTRALQPLGRIAAEASREAPETYPTGK